jgi:hypothetical protein
METGLAQRLSRWTWASATSSDMLVTSATALEDSPSPGSATSPSIYLACHIYNILFQILAISFLLFFLISS